MPKVLWCMVTFLKPFHAMHMTVFVSVCHTMSLSILVSKRFHTVSETPHNNRFRLSVGSYLLQSSQDQPHVIDIFTMMPHSSQDKFSYINYSFHAHCNQPYHNITKSKLWSSINNKFACKYLSTRKGLFTIDNPDKIQSLLTSVPKKVPALMGSQVH